MKKCCPFCKENKKRPLVKYMRNRESRKHHESICEDEEEQQEEEESNEAEEEEELQFAEHHEHKHHLNSCVQMHQVPNVRASS